MPTTTTTTAQGSPLSGLATLGALSQTPAASALASGIKGLASQLTSPSGGTPVDGNPNGLANIDKSGWIDNGDGSFTTTTGQVVDANGNPYN